MKPRKRGVPSTAVRMRVMKRDKFQCTYCGVAGTQAELQVDHIIALAKGGSHHMSNLTTACRACNQRKSDGAAIRRPSHHAGLVGMFLHVFKDGHIECQGEIIAVDGYMVLIEWFEWLCGFPVFVEALTKSFVYSEQCRLYKSAESMNLAYSSRERLLLKESEQALLDAQTPHLSGGVQEAESEI